MTQRAIVLGAWIGLAGIGAGLATPAVAQSVGDSFVVPNLPIEYDRGRNTGVLDRPRPQYDALGVKIGGFTLFPRLETSIGYSDNVYQSASNRKSDGVADLSPSARLTSDWSRHSFTLDGAADVKRFFTETRRNQDSWHVGASGRYDLGGQATLSASARTERATEPPTSAAYPTAAAAASQYQSTQMQLNAGYAPGRLKLQGGFTFIALGFDDVLTFANGVVSQANRNSHTESGSGRVEYALSPDTSVFVQTTYDRVAYARPLATGIPNRSSDTYRGLAGATFDLSTLLRGSLGVGYMRRRYDSAIYRPIGGLTAEARMEYFPTPLTTVTVSGRRLIEDASFLNSGGFVNNTVALRLDHELLRYVLLDTQIGYEHDSYKGTNASLDIVRASGGARYILTREFGLGVSVAHDLRAAHGASAGPSYHETRFLLSIVAQR
ncbi:outer membrane beta-barrel protein [Sphingomonas sp. CARO-RG-8B-R24-01]|uniref:outer membrane beta-barrel protein n=1 Tax=Sphingomonas sp. CARO-RG-8B-R24-01 TaxID=2914831 RepID=UPI001F5896F9|nr:outer membrane beta-barrel protein [Sphingomonas sp. CARO-RG-8B-R24-01]